MADRSTTPQLMEKLLAQKLTRAEILNRLHLVANEEYALPEELQDSGLIQECLELRWFLLTGERYLSRKEEAKRKLNVILKSKACRIKSRRKYDLRVPFYRIGFSFAFVLILMILPMIGQRALRHEWIYGITINNGEIYQLNGEEINPVFVENAIADMLMMDISISSADYRTVSNLPGVSQMHPNYIPENLTSYRYSYVVAGGILYYSEFYQSPLNDKTMVYRCTVYPDAEAVANDIEQNEEGTVEFVDGHPVYFAQNIDLSVATWSTNLTSYLVSGPLQKEEIKLIIESIGGK